MREGRLARSRRNYERVTDARGFWTALMGNNIEGIGGKGVVLYVYGVML